MVEVEVPDTIRRAEDRNIVIEAITIKVPSNRSIPFHSPRSNDFICTGIVVVIVIPPTIRRAEDRNIVIEAITIKVTC